MGIQEALGVVQGYRALRALNHWRPFSRVGLLNYAGLVFKNIDSYHSTTFRV